MTPFLALVLLAVPTEPGSIVQDSERAAAVALTRELAPAPAPAGTHGAPRRVPAFGLGPAGEVVGRGPGYRVDVAEGWTRFTPVLGARATERRHLATRVVEVRRRDEVLYAFGAAPTVSASRSRASQVLAPGLTERIDVRADGVEQSWALHERPAGAGELVVRLAVDTNLLAGAGERPGEALRFERAGEGGVGYGVAVVVDANGTRTPAEVRWSPGTIELAVDAATVDDAAYPLVLDPVLTPLPHGDIGGNAPDLAFEALNERWALIWEEELSFGSHDLWLEVYESDGTPVALRNLVAGLADEPMPAIAAMPSTQSFVYAWRSGSIQISVARLSAVVPTLTPVASTVSTFNDVVDLDLGGDPSVLFEHAWLTWSEETFIEDFAYGTRVLFEAGNFPVAEPATFLAPGRHVSTTSSNGIQGFWLTAVTHPSASLPVQLFRSSFNGGISGTATLPQTGTGGSARVVGDGFDFLSVCTVGGELRANRIQYDVVNQVLTVDPDHVVVDKVGGSNTLGATAAVDGGFHALVAWSRTVGGTNELRYQAIDLRDLDDCEPSVALSVGLQDDVEHIALAARTQAITGAYPQRVAVLAHDRQDTSTTGFPVELGLEVQLVDDVSLPDETFLGGACGDAGFLNVPSVMRVGEPLDIQLLNSAPSTLAILNIASPLGADLTCGPCIWTPFQITRSTLTSPAGYGLRSFMVPCDPTLIGATIRTQWTVYTPGLSPCSITPDLSLTGRWDVTFGA